MNSPHTLTHPFDETDAREAERTASALQLGAEATLREAFASAAEAEREYRRALAAAILQARADGHPATVCADLARGDEHVSELRYKRDVADGVKEAAVQSAWRHAANRKALGRLVEWSARRDLSLGADPEQPAHREDVPPVGSPGYRAARAA